MTHDEYRELLPAHALGGLDAAETQALENHLESCPECRAELGALRDAAGLLAHAADPVAPQPQNRERILEQVRAQKVTPMPQPRQISVLLRPAPILSGLAIAAGLVWIVLFQVDTWKRLNETQDRLDEALARLADAQELLTRERATKRFLTRPDAVTVALQGTEAAPAAKAKVAYDPSTGRALLFAAGLPPAPAHKGYQLWFIAGDEPPMPGRVFFSDPTGRAELTDRIPPAARENPVFAVTLEPAGGVPAPTGPIVLASAGP